jgi:ribose transport system ATP-binding protein
MSEPPLFSASDLSKSYAAPVLTAVALEVGTGEVLALVGENGAGKTTLSRIMAGLARPDAGTMRLRGAPYSPRSRAEAHRAGVAIVTQELALIPTLTVAESLFIDRLPTKGRVGFVDRRRLDIDARKALAAVGLARLDPGRLVETLSLAERQLVEVAGALARSPDLLILDEPTSALSPAEASRLFEQVRRLRDAGRSVVFVSHRLDEVEEIGDRIAVLRDGRVIAIREARLLARDEMVRLMVGRDVAPLRERRRPRAGGSVLRAVGLGGRGFRDVTLDVREGEIVGLAGLMGAGRTELLRALFGAEAPTAGSVWVAPSADPIRIASPHDAVGLGIGLVTEDRKTDGLLLPLSLAANISLAHLPTLASAWGVVDSARERTSAARLVDALSIRARSVDQPVIELSGGNQQKALLARWLFRDSKVLLVDEPTRGIDVGSRAEVHGLLGHLADRGKGILAASSDLEELMALCDRILVMSMGRLVGEFQRGAWTAEAILVAALSGHAPAGATA